jgi:hypothetical protein
MRNFGSHKASIKRVIREGHVHFDVQGRIERLGLFNISGRTIAAAYRPFTGSWYFFDPETGREVGCVDNDFFEEYFERLRTWDLGSVAGEAVRGWRRYETVEMSTGS